jgi:hypothetical protein
MTTRFNASHSDGLILNLSIIAEAINPLWKKDIKGRMTSATFVYNKHDRFPCHKQIIYLYKRYRRLKRNFVEHDTITMRMLKFVERGIRGTDKWNAATLTQNRISCGQYVKNCLNIFKKWKYFLKFLSSNPLL